MLIWPSTAVNGVGAFGAAVLGDLFCAWARAEIHRDWAARPKVLSRLGLASRQEGTTTRRAPARNSVEIARANAAATPRGLRPPGYTEETPAWQQSGAG